MVKRSSKALKPVKKVLKKLEKMSLLRSKFVLYLTLLLTIALSLIYISKNNWDALTTLVIVGVLTNYFTKNMTITLGISVIVSLVIFNRNSNLFNVEGMENAAGDDAIADDATPEETADVAADDAGDLDKPVGEATGEELDNEADLNFCFVRDADTKQYVKNGDKKVKQEVCDVVPQSCWASSSADCKSKTGFSNKDIPSSKPQRVDGKKDIEDDDSEGIRIDYSKTLEAAYDNLQDVLGKDGIKGLTGETTKLINEQKDLMNSMKSIGPMMSQATQMMESLNKMNLGSISGVLKK